MPCYYPLIKLTENSNYNSMAEHFANIHLALELIPGTT